LTSSAISPSDIRDYSIEELEAVDLNVETTKGLADSQVRYVKSKVIDCNEACGMAGNAIRAAAMALSDIKKDVKNKNWKALTDSGALSMSARNARDLVTAYDTWLAVANIPQSALSQVSYRTLCKIGGADASQRMKAISLIQEGKGFSEGDLNKLLRKKAKPRMIEEVVESWKKSAKAKWESLANEKEKYAEYESKGVENAKLKADNARLRKENAKLKG
tara:strand:- start:311 stop:967 length:657 start_codon:yes stop_codon:yes gene_type:complete